MVREISAKTILSPLKQPDTWFGTRYSMNIYRGCQHSCIYCDTRSECYRIDDLKDIAVKTNAIELLQKELHRKRKKGTIGTGSMNDPYMPVEKEYGLTRKALKVIRERNFPVHIMTKSDLVFRDKDIIKEISQTYAAVSFTITTTDDRLAAILEPGAPPPSARLKAMQELARAGIYTGVTLIPVLPFILDDKENIKNVVLQTAQYGGRYILASFGVTLRDRQREYYYRQLDRHFPGMKKKYQSFYGERYSCLVPEHDERSRFFHDLCQNLGIQTRMKFYAPEEPDQLELF